MYVYHMYTVPKKARRVIQSPEPELQMVMNSHLGARNQTQVP